MLRGKGIPNYNRFAKNAERFLFLNEGEEKKMKVAWNGLQAAIATVGAWLGWFLGGYDGFLYALVAFSVIDYLTGVQTCALPISQGAYLNFSDISLEPR